jgi:hypothetical protein
MGEKKKNKKLRLRLLAPGPSRRYLGAFCLFGRTGIVMFELGAVLVKLILFWPIHFFDCEFILMMFLVVVLRSPSTLVWGFCVWDMIGRIVDSRGSGFGAPI